MRKPQKSQLKEKIEEVGLGHHRKLLEQVMSQAIRLLPQKTKAPPLGASRLGGLPDLPPGTEWPVIEGIFLEFVGQISLEDLAPSHAEEILPSQGWLSFFFDGMLTGYERGEAKDRCRVLYHNSPLENLQRLAPPPDL